ncbi:MAG: response regulator transcription factor [Clostridium sp.]|uniref:LytR/AlgR family response regulator transcription factor n=1 Tax=Clostridium sp. TaxID=1506 RepID=UPI0025BFF829|nr:LytTR family DNA-binding domain-containing protein [Clostridium sp.]MCF0146792.1 response regulator transcription factor [Clostridium sp.]
MKIAICEDQDVQINLLNNHIHNWAKEKDTKISIDTFNSAEEFLFEWSDYNKYDIIFLDVNLSKMSGVELSNIIREKNTKIDIVFVTGLFKYALHGYRVRALQYLIKPIKITDLYYCLDTTLDRINNDEEVSSFVLETSKKVIKLDYNEIYYFVMFSPYIDIHTNSEKITVRKNISEIEMILPNEYFVRCHRSYIVNIKHIKSIVKNNIMLENGVNIPISRGKYKEVNETFINYICE